MTYSEQEVKFLMGAFVGALIKSGHIKQDTELILETVKVFKEFWADYRDISKLPDQELVQFLVKNS